MEIPDQVIADLLQEWRRVGKGVRETNPGLLRAMNAVQEAVPLPAPVVTADSAEARTGQSVDPLGLVPPSPDQTIAPGAVDWDNDVPATGASQ